jgi:16S rRNA (adenine(1408)-N(1))-methyltransferase
LPHTGEGVVIDIGTGDGRFVLAAARANPRKFFIGIDANTKPLEKPSMKATRKPAKGGLPNVLFVQAAVEDLPDDLNDTADEIHIHFPWGSLLRAVAIGDQAILASLRRIAAADCLLEVIIGIDPDRDRTELARHGLPELTDDYLENCLIPKYRGAGFEMVEYGRLERKEWARLETSWARKLSSNDNRKVLFLLFSIA